MYVLIVVNFIIVFNYSFSISLKYPHHCHEIMPSYQGTLLPCLIFICYLFCFVLSESFLSHCYLRWPYDLLWPMKRAVVLYATMIEEPLCVKVLALLFLCQKNKQYVRAPGWLSQ